MDTDDYRAVRTQPRYNMHENAITVAEEGFARECRDAWVRFAAAILPEMLDAEETGRCEQQISVLAACVGANQLLAEYVRRFGPKE